MPDSSKPHATCSEPTVMAGLDPTVMAGLDHTVMAGLDPAISTHEAHYTAGHR